MELIIGFLTSQVALYAGGGLVAVILAWILKRIPNERIKAAVGAVAYRLGVAVTLGLARWKYTAPYWNKIVEPWFVDLLDNVVVEALRRFIDGLRSD